MGLTAYERETVIVLNDEDELASIFTAQRPWITSLKKNETATLVEEGTHEGTAWAQFEIPKANLTIRAKKRAGNSKANFKGNPCGAVKANGDVCKAPARKETGKCRHHS